MPHLTNPKTKNAPEHVTVGCYVYVHKPEDGPDSTRKAQILSKRTSDSSENEYYVHYLDYNKRLDEWVTLKSIDLTKQIENNKEKKSKSTSFMQAFGKHSKTSTSGKGGRGGKTMYKDLSSKKNEIEKLRVSGSMTQNANEISRVKNFDKIQFGQYEVETWYFSPYPKEYQGKKLVFICEFCLVSHIEESRFVRHRQKCNLFHPPGNEIYRKGEYSFFELDGRKQRHYCRRLSLVSKLFLDHKTLYYDVDPFLFYVLTKNDEFGCHLVGYFSKEKQSVDNYNVACILTMPQYQRMGFGRVLISFSYELSKIEGKTGSPEKPLSDLGLLGYRAYWSETITEKLIEYSGEISIEEISTMTSITPQDVVHTLQYINALRYYKGSYIICLTNSIIENYQRSMSKKKIIIDPASIQWKPSLIL